MKSLLANNHCWKDLDCPRVPWQQRPSLLLRSPCMDELRCDHWQRSSSWIVYELQKLHPARQLPKVDRGTSSQHLQYRESLSQEFPPWHYSRRTLWRRASDCRCRCDREGLPMAIDARQLARSQRELRPCYPHYQSKQTLVGFGHRGRIVDRRSWLVVDSVRQREHCWTLCLLPCWEERTDLSVVQTCLRRGCDWLSFRGLPFVRRGSRRNCFECPDERLLLLPASWMTKSSCRRRSDSRFQRHWKILSCDDTRRGASARRPREEERSQSRCYCDTKPTQWTQGPSMSARVLDSHQAETMCREVLA